LFRVRDNPTLDKYRSIRDATIRYGSARYPMPHTLVGEQVWIRVRGLPDQIA